MTCELQIEYKKWNKKLIPWEIEFTEKYLSFFINIDLLPYKIDYYIVTEKMNAERCYQYLVLKKKLAKSALQNPAPVGKFW